MIVECEGAFDAVRAFVPVIAAPAMRPAPTVKPARTTKSFVMRSPFVRRIVRRRAVAGIRSNRDVCCPLTAESLRVSAEPLPALEGAARGRPRDANARVDRDVALRQGDHRVEVKLGDLGKAMSEPGKPL